MNYQSMSASEILAEINRGARFVRYSYAISIIVLSFFRESEIYMIGAGQSDTARVLRYSGITLLAGWWGFPWGPIYSFKALYRNINGGRDVTSDIARSLSRA